MRHSISREDSGAAALKAILAASDVFAHARTDPQTGMSRSLLVAKTHPFLAVHIESGRLEVMPALLPPLLKARLYIASNASVEACRRNDDTGHPSCARLRTHDIARVQLPLSVSFGSIVLAGTQRALQTSVPARRLDSHAAAPDHKSDIVPKSRHRSGPLHTVNSGEIGWSAERLHCLRLPSK